MIELEKVSKVFPSGTVAVRDLSLRVPEGETLVLLGTSGCGKTTTLKMINRLVEPTSGRIVVNGRDIREQDPIELRRGIGYAIQHVGLFPHMTVKENVAVVPTLLKWPRERIDPHVDELLSMAGLEPEEFRERFPFQLSGGQRQRVGVARALASDPPIILMDEPFGALDPITREELQNEFIDLQANLKKTIIFVTHDVFEAVKMGDQIALLDAGSLKQAGTPTELVESPADDFVDGFLGQHRFQLSLLTRAVRSIMTDASAAEAKAPTTPPPPATRLRATSSLVEALDMFKKTGTKNLDVYDAGRPVGNLTKRHLLDVILQLLGETGSTPS